MRIRFIAPAPHSIFAVREIVVGFRERACPNAGDIPRPYDRRIGILSVAAMTRSVIRGFNQRMEVRSQDAAVSIRKLAAEVPELNDGLDELEQVVQPMNQGGQ